MGRMRLSAVLVVSRHEEVDANLVHNPNALTLKESRQLISAGEARLRGAEAVLSIPGFARAERMGERIAELMHKEVGQRGVFFTGISSGLPRTKETIEHHLNGFKAFMQSKDVKLRGSGRAPGYALFSNPSLALRVPESVPHYPIGLEKARMDERLVEVARGKRFPEWEALVVSNKRRTERGLKPIGYLTDVKRRMSQIHDVERLLTKNALRTKPTDPVQVIEFDTHGGVEGNLFYIDRAVAKITRVPAGKIPGGSLERGAALVHLIYTDGTRVSKKSVILRREPGKKPDARILPPVRRRK